MKTDPRAIIEGEVVDTLELNTQLQHLEHELMGIPQFKKFLELQKSINDRAATTWKKVEEQMIEFDIKKIEGEWGSLTIAERLDFMIDEDELPPRFKKTVPDTTKIRTVYLLDKRPIRGATPKVKKYLTKRLKLGVISEVS